LRLTNTKFINQMLPFLELQGSGAAGLFDAKSLIGRDIIQLLQDAGRPMDFQRHLAVVRQTKMYSQVAAGGIPDTIGDKASLRTRATADHPCADSGAVAARAGQFELQPVSWGALVGPQFDGLMQ
jgi:hypothetical protein